MTHTTKKFMVDFEMAGQIPVEAKNREEAIEMVKEGEFEGVIDDYVQSLKVGEHYVEEVEKDDE